MATGFRAPDATDRFGYGGNVNLRPETSRNTELGYHHSFAPRHYLSLQAFDNRIDDLINFYDPDGFLGPTPGMNINIDKARIRGIEASYVIDHGPWGIHCSLVTQKPENRSTGDLLARRAERSLTISGHHTFSRWRFDADMIATSERKDSDFSSTVNPGYALFNVNASYTLTTAVRLDARIGNLFDRDYTLADGYNTDGRNYMFEVRYSPDS
jgi:vitamin B12 transporter